MHNRCRCAGERRAGCDRNRGRAGSCCKQERSISLAARTHRRNLPARISRKSARFISFFFPPPPLFFCFFSPPPPPLPPPPPPPPPLFHRAIAIDRSKARFGQSARIPRSRRAAYRDVREAGANEMIAQSYKVWKGPTRGTDARPHSKPSQCTSRLMASIYYYPPSL